MNSLREQYKPETTARMAALEEQMRALTLECLDLEIAELQRLTAGQFDERLVMLTALRQQVATVDFNDKAACGALVALSGLRTLPNPNAGDVARRN